MSVQQGKTENVNYNSNLCVVLYKVSSEDFKMDLVGSLLNLDSTFQSNLTEMVSYLVKMTF